MELSPMPVFTSMNDADLEHLPMSQEEFMRLCGHAVLDLAEAEMVENYTSFEPPVTHRRAPGVYIREIYMQAGLLITSKVHRTEHAFFILQGEVSVWTPDQGAVRLAAPFTGITKPGTRRLLFIHSDCVWVTCHRCFDEETIDQIEARIIEPHLNPLLAPELNIHAAMTETPTFHPAEVGT